MPFILAQKNTVDEFPIHYIIEGNKDSNKAIIMVHGGGMDLQEIGKYPAMENGKPKKVGNNNKVTHTLLKEMHIGNYDRISTELQILEPNQSIVRIDLRNHGLSLNDNQMDKRDLSLERLARDLSSVIDELDSKYNYEEITLIGTCLGGLTCQCYATGIGANNINDMKNREKVKKIILDCSLSFNNLYTNNKEDKFCYDKCQQILTNPKFQFNKMKGVYEGINTIKEAIKIGDISRKVAELGIPILYIYAKNDRIINYRTSQNIAKNLAAFNNNVIIKEVNDNSHGLSDHCLYDPQSSDALLITITDFLESKSAIKTK